MPDKQDQKKKEGERKDKKTEAMHEHEHEIHSGQRQSEQGSHPAAEPDLVTQNHSIGHHKQPEIVESEPAKRGNEEKDMRHSHVPHEHKAK